ncbi:hypothetical protein HCN44_007496, partial [Aphidius gifuensis]
NISIINFRKQIFVYVISLMSGSTCYFIGKIIEADVPVFPHYIWVPYDSSNPYYYWTTYFFFTSPCIIASLIAIQFVLFFSSTTLIIQSQVAILKYRFKKSMEIIEQIYNKNNNNHDDDIIGKLKKLERKLIVDFVDNHLEILKLAGIINDIFSIDFFCFYSTSTISICTTAYVLSTVPLFSNQFFVTTLLSGIVLCQITMMSFASNAISIAFEELNNEITSANWTILGDKTKKDLMIVMMKTQKPFTFTTGKIIQPDRESLKN